LHQPPQSNPPNPGPGKKPPLLDPPPARCTEGDPLCDATRRPR
jgi:hypothetical protein